MCWDKKVTLRPLFGSEIGNTHRAHRFQLNWGNEALFNSNALWGASPALVERRRQVSKV